MNVEALQIIELDAARAPAPMVDHYIQLVRSSLADCTADTAEYANALLLKLEHLASHQRVHAIDSSLTGLPGALARHPVPVPAGRGLIVHLRAVRCLVHRTPAGGLSVVAR